MNPGSLTAISYPRGECRRCGNCCQTPRLFVLPSGDKADFVDWLSGYGITLQTVEVEGEKFEVALINVRCQHLDFDAQGQAVCTNYEQRPNICRKYTCPKLAEV